MSLMETFANPEVMHSMSMGEKLIGGLITTLMGMGITFIVLLMLWVVIVAITKLIGKSEPKKVKQEAVTPVQVNPDPKIVDSQLVAVITAAIAASAGPTAMTNISVKRISRVSGNAPAWGRAGIGESIDSRRI